VDQNPTIELFAFGDGIRSEIILFGDAARAQRRATAGPVSEVCCRSCGSDLVHPLAWESTSEEVWLLQLRCPECELVFDIALNRYSMERYVTQLHSQKRALAHDLAYWDLACFREDMERLLRLIGDDTVLPADF